MNDMADEAAILGLNRLDMYAFPIVTAARKMNDIVDALLLLARVRSVEVTRQPINMSYILPDVLQRLEGMLQEYQP